MRSIVFFEFKKILLNRKNIIVAAVFFAMLVSFAASEMVKFQEERVNDVSYYRAKSNFWENKALIAIESYMRDNNLTEWTVPDDPSYRRFVLLQDMYTELCGIFPQNDRLRELELLYEIELIQLELGIELYDLYADAGSRYASLAEIYKGNVKYREANADFLSRCYEAGAALLYESEMTGFNFLYQSLRRFVPFALYIVLFLVLADVFALENDYGSYKFLLLQPLTRGKVFLSKLLASFFASFVFLFGPMIAVFLLMGVINGFGSPGYPVLIQKNFYSAVTPLMNQWSRSYLNPLPGSDEGEIYDIYTEKSIIRERFMYGMTPYSPWEITYLNSRNYTITHSAGPSPELRPCGIGEFLIWCIPLLAFNFIMVSCASALVSVTTQRGAMAIVFCSLIGLTGFMSSVPTSDLKILDRLNPILYTNPVPILNGIGSTTALTGIVVMVFISAVTSAAALTLFRKRDIRA